MVDNNSKGPVNNNPILQRKLNAAKNPDSIFLPNYLAFQLRIADRIITDIRRRASVSLSIEQAKECMKAITDMSTALWDFVFKLSPKLAVNGFDARRWRELNDSYEVKVRQANRKAMGYIIPRSEEAGQLAMALRLISENIIIAKHKVSFDELESISKEYTLLVKGFIPKLQDIAVKAKVSNYILEKLKSARR